MVKSRTRTPSRQESQRESIDTGTTELHRRLSTRVERRRSGTVCIRVLDGNQVDHLLWADQITPDEHSVLTGFQLDAHRAGLVALRASNLQKVSGGGHEMSDAEAILRVKHNKACDFLTLRIGSGGLARVLAVCIDDRPPAKGDLSILRQACDVLMVFRSSWSKPGSGPSA